MPTLRYLDEAHMTTVPEDWGAPEAATPLPAWRPDFNNRAFDGPFSRVVRSAYLAHTWVLKEAASGTFPMLYVKPKQKLKGLTV